MIDHTTTYGKDMPSMQNQDANSFQQMLKCQCGECKWCLAKERAFDEDNDEGEE